MLGLDKLAEAKKKEKMENNLENNEEPKSKRSKVFSYKADEEEAQSVEYESTDHIIRDKDKKLDFLLYKTNCLNMNPQRIKCLFLISNCF